MMAGYVFFCILLVCAMGFFCVLAVGAWEAGDRIVSIGLWVLAYICIYSVLRSIPPGLGE